MAVVTAVSACRFRQHVRRRNAINSITSSDVRLSIDCKPGQLWLFREEPIYGVYFEGEVNRRSVLALSEFTEAKFVLLNYRNFTDDDLLALRDFHRLTKLGLRATQVTDVGVNRLATYDAPIKSLDLGMTSITDNAVAAICQFKDLKELRIAGTQITNSGLTRLEQHLTQCIIHPASMPDEQTDEPEHSKPSALNP